MKSVKYSAQHIVGGQNCSCLPLCSISWLKPSSLSPGPWNLPLHWFPILPHPSPKNTLSPSCQSAPSKAQSSPFLAGPALKPPMTSHHVWIMSSHSMEGPLPSGPAWFSGLISSLPYDPWPFILDCSHPAHHLTLPKMCCARCHFHFFAQAVPSACWNFNFLFGCSLLMTPPPWVFPGILYSPCPSPRISHFSKVPWFPPVQVSETKVWMLGVFVLLGCHSFLALSLDRTVKYIYAYPCIPTYL